MVYCNKSKQEKNSCIYNIGASIDDITGIIDINVNCEYELIKQADNVPVTPYDIAKLISANRSDIEKGVFNDKIAYEA